MYSNAGRHINACTYIDRYTHTDTYTDTDTHTHTHVEPDIASLIELIKVHGKCSSVLGFRDRPASRLVGIPVQLVHFQQGAGSTLCNAIPWSRGLKAGPKHCQRVTHTSTVVPMYWKLTD